jgi:uncharacterized protein
MKIHLHEITDIETELDFTEGEPWVVAAVESVDEIPEEGIKALVKEIPNAPTGLRSKKLAKRAIQTHFSLRKVDDVVVIEGSVETQIQLLCSRCANPFEMQIHPQFSGLFCKDPVMAGVAHLAGKGKPGGTNRGFARHEHDKSLDQAMEVGNDLDITYLSDDTIDLKAVLTEQLQLQVPFQPLCRQDCKGICSNCGADLNVGRCACAKVAKTNPFAALKELKRDLKLT